MVFDRNEDSITDNAKVHTVFGTKCCSRRKLQPMYNDDDDDYGFGSLLLLGSSLVLKQT